MPAFCKRSHPVTILLFLEDNAYWLLLPLSRRLYGWFIGEAGVWQWGLVFDAVVGGLVVLWSYLRWRGFLYGCRDGCFRYRQGVLFVRENAVPLCHLSALERDSHVLSRLFHLRRVRLYPDSAPWGKPALTFFVRHERRPADNAPSRDAADFCAFGLSILCFALYSSGIYLVVFVLSGLFFPKQLPGIVSLLFEQDALLSFLAAQGIFTPESLYDLLLSILPYPVFGLAMVWAAVFLLRLDDIFALRAAVDHKTLQVYRGFLRRRQISLPLFFLDHLEARQGILGRCFGRCSLYVYRKTEGGLLPKPHLLLPLHPAAALSPQIAQLLPSFAAKPSRSIRPDKTGAVWGYLFAPVVILVILPLSVLLLRCLFPGFRSSLTFMSLPLGLLSLWFLWARWTAYRTSGIFVHGDVMVLRYSFGLTLHTLWAPKTSLLCLQTQQHPLQAMSNRCDAIFRLTGTPRKSLRIRNLPFRSLRQLQDTLIQS